MGNPKYSITCFFVFGSPGHDGSRGGTSSPEKIRSKVLRKPSPELFFRRSSYLLPDSLKDTLANPLALLTESISTFVPLDRLSAEKTFLLPLQPSSKRMLFGKTLGRQSPPR